MNVNLVLENDRELELEHINALEELGWNESNTDFFLSLYATANQHKFEECFKKIAKGEYKSLCVYSVYVKESYGMLLQMLRWSTYEDIKGFEVLSCAVGMLTEKLNKLISLDKYRAFVWAIKFVTNNSIYEYNSYNGKKMRIEFDPTDLKFKYQ